jgi:hypothetical protein
MEEGLPKILLGILKGIDLDIDSGGTRLTIELPEGEIEDRVFLGDIPEDFIGRIIVFGSSYDRKLGGVYYSLFQRIEANQYPHRSYEGRLKIMPSDFLTSRRRSFERPDERLVA